jgi:hypothetical protein
LQFAGTLPGHPVPLTTCLRTETPGTSHPVALWQGRSAPLTAWSLAFP